MIRKTNSSVYNRTMALILVEYASAVSIYMHMHFWCRLFTADQQFLKTMSMRKHLMEDEQTLERDLP
jgi:hypothetical protein